MKTRRSLLAGFVDVLFGTLIVASLVLFVVCEPADAVCKGDVQCSVGCREAHPPCPQGPSSNPTCSTKDEICATCTCTAISGNTACSCL